jgi:hypothetical protein
MKLTGLLRIALIGLLPVSVLLGYGCRQESSGVSLASGADALPSQTEPQCTHQMDEKLGISPEVRSRLEIFGYQSEIALGDAVELVNQQIRCSSLFRGQAPLTEDEVIASIVAGADYGKQGEIWVKQSDVLWKIAVDRKLPASSLLMVTSGPRRLDSPLAPRSTIAAKGISITLILNIDAEHGLLMPPRPEDTHVIRKNYSRIERVE